MNRRNPPCRVTPRLARVGALALAAMLLSASGCARVAPDLVVATSWPADARRLVESDFARWAGDTREDRAVFRGARISWLYFAPGEDPMKLAFRASPPQVVLGSPAGTLSRLATMNRIAAIESAKQARWCEIARPRGDGARSLEPGGVWNDPRRDRGSLRWAMNQLASSGWREGYARLIHAAAAKDRITPSLDPSTLTVQSNAQPSVPDGSSAAQSDVIEAAAIVSGAGKQELAQGFLKFLVETRGARAPAAGSGSQHAEFEEISSLIADLLGATLVDAQDELWLAVRALEQVDDKEQATKWLTEPPPWPPASVAKYLEREGEHAMELIETLGALVAPEASERAWLLRSWLSPARPVDPSLLSELAEASGGRLCREERFRAWLREEWTAWARQRYRRVARWSGSRTNRPDPHERTSSLR